jgi:hypothetical protein
MWDCVLWEGLMDLASVFEWFAQETMNLAERANKPKQRERLLALAVLWVTAPRQNRSEAPARQSTSASS